MKTAPILLLLILAVLLVSPAVAQDSVFPLPAPLYILNSNGQVLRVDSTTGGQTVISPDGQPVVDFAIAPDGGWYVYRTTLNNAVIVSDMNSGSGFVLQFDAPMPPANAIPGRSIAWSPDTSMIAYLMQGGVTIAALSAGDYGEPVLHVIQGDGWVSLRWAAPDTLVLKTASGETTRVTGAPDNWTVKTTGTEAEASAAQPLEAFLAPAGVTLAGGRIVPGTEGAAAYNWGPLPPESVDHLMMADNLTYLAPDAAGNTQVWQLPANGDPAHPLTTESAPVSAYAIQGDRIAFVTQNRLIAAALDGSDARELATPELADGSARVDWSPDGTQIAYSDSRGVWVVMADGSQPPRLLAKNQPFDSGDTRYYFEPRWSPDSTRLLVGVGYYEGSSLGVVDVVSGDITELYSLTASLGHWTPDGRVLTWAWTYGYQVPGLYLLDPATPDAEPQTILGENYAVVDVTRSAAGRWYVLVNTSTTIGPQFVQVLAADTLDGPFEFPYLYEEGVGAFLERPTLAPPHDDQPSADSAPVFVAGLRNITYDERGRAQGELVITDLNSQYLRAIQTSGPVSGVQWSGE